MISNWDILGFLSSSVFSILLVYLFLVFSILKASVFFNLIFVPLKVFLFLHQHH